mmetsp:Transcript_19734/g.42867  ORF Transcript_19734/g.42867 Transcript_19734/m.42867 type:complete len:587 (-) Transcript_19734:364-2124(-)
MKTTYYAAHEGSIDVDEFQQLLAKRRQAAVRRASGKSLNIIHQAGLQLAPPLQGFNAYPSKIAAATEAAEAGNISNVKKESSPSPREQAGQTAGVEASLAQGNTLTKQERREAQQVRRLEQLETLKEARMSEKEVLLQKMQQQEHQIAAMQQRLESLNDDKHELVIKLKQVLQSEGSMKRQGTASFSMLGNLAVAPVSTQKPPGSPTGSMHGMVTPSSMMAITPTSAFSGGVHVPAMYQHLPYGQPPAGMLLGAYAAGVQPQQLTAYTPSSAASPAPQFQQTPLSPNRLHGQLASPDYARQARPGPFAQPIGANMPGPHGPAQPTTSYDSGRLSSGDIGEVVDGQQLRRGHHSLHARGLTHRGTSASNLPGQQTSSGQYLRPVDGRRLSDSSRFADRMDVKPGERISDSGRQDYWGQQHTSSSQGHAARSDRHASASGSSSEDDGELMEEGEVAPSPPRSNSLEHRPKDVRPTSSNPAASGPSPANTWLPPHLLSSAQSPRTSWQQSAPPSSSQLPPHLKHGTGSGFQQPQSQQPQTASQQQNAFASGGASGPNIGPQRPRPQPPPSWGGRGGWQESMGRRNSYQY